MSKESTPRLSGERGATLILAIAFLLVIGAIGSAVMTSVASGISNRRTLDQVRNKQYAADGGVEFAIAQVRAVPLPGGPGVAPCRTGAITDHYNTTLNAINIRVDCANHSTITPSGFLQRNVVFTACVDTGAQCTNPNTIVRAQVNYEARSAGSTLNVTRTWVQSWSVNR